MAPLQGGLYETSRGEGFSQASCDLPYRVYASQPLSLPSINGSTIIVTAHSRGITIIWRGGRRFIHQPEDSDAFEPEEEDIRCTPACQQPIVHRLDVHLGVAVTGLSLCSLPPGEYDDHEPLIIVAAVCSDNKIRVLKLPSTPTLGEDARDASSIPTAIIPSRGKPISTSIKWTKKENKGLHKDTGNAISDLDLLVAICSDGAFGKLSVTRIPANFVSEAFMPFHSQILRRPAKKVSFCPFLYPSPRHTEILVCFPSGSISIFDPSASVFVS